MAIVRTNRQALVESQNALDVYAQNIGRLRGSAGRIASGCTKECEDEIAFCKQRVIEAKSEVAQAGQEKNRFLTQQDAAEKEARAAHAKEYEARSGVSQAWAEAARAEALAQYHEAQAASLAMQAQTAGEQAVSLQGLANGHADDAARARVQAENARRNGGALEAQANAAAARAQAAEARVARAAAAAKEAAAREARWRQQLAAREQRLERVSEVSKRLVDQARAFSQRVIAYETLVGMDVSHSQQALRRLLSLIDQYEDTSI